MGAVGAADADCLRSVGGATARTASSSHALAPCREPRPLWLLEGWDYRWYSGIANHGYSYGGASSYAFFPLWPTVLRVFAEVGAQTRLAIVAATLISGLVFSSVAVTHPFPRRAAVALASMPGSFALLLPYADGLALALGALAFLTAKRGNWAAAAALAFLAGTARPNGFILALLLAGLAWRSDNRWRWAAVAAPISGFLLVNGAFWLLSGQPAAFLHAEKHWGRGSPSALFGSLNGRWAALQVAAAAAACILLWLLWRSRQRFGISAFLFAGSVVFLSLSSGTFSAFSRQMLFAFPLIWTAADIRAKYATVAAVAGIAANIANILLLPQVFP